MINEVRIADKSSVDLPYFPPYRKDRLEALVIKPAPGVFSVSERQLEPSSLVVESGGTSHPITRALTNSHQEIYDSDFVLWAERAAKLLEQRRFEEIDLENLIEEVRELAKNAKREVRNRLFELLKHLLKWQYQPSRRQYPGTDNAWNENSWARSINNQRYGIKQLLDDSGSLKKHFSDSVYSCYEHARKAAAKETGLSIGTFPEECPYSEQDIKDENFWPD